MFSCKCENLLGHIIMPFLFHPPPHSENYLVKWSSSGLVKDIEQLNNLRAVFTVSVFAYGHVWLSVRVCTRLPVVVRYLFSYVTRHVGACLQSLCLLSSLRESLARSMYLPRQSPLSNGSPRAGGSAGPHWEHFCYFWKTLLKEKQSVFTTSDAADAVCGEKFPIN